MPRYLYMALLGLPLQRTVSAVDSLPEASKVDPRLGSSSRRDNAAGGIGHSLRPRMDKMTSSPKSPSDLRTRVARSLLTIRVARMHYLEGMSNLAIADALKISRFRVARLLDQALASGIVKIMVAAPVEVDQALSDAMRSKYGIVDALVLPVSHSDGKEADYRASVGQLTALYLAELATEGSKIGVSWGRTLDAVVAGLVTQPRYPRCDVLQLVGNLPTKEGSMHAGDVLRGFANAFRGEVYPLHAPLILPNRATAEGMRTEVSVSRVLSMVNDLDLAVVGIGCWQPPSSRLMEVLPESDVTALKQLQPLADVCANVYNAEGEVLVGDYSGRVIGVTHDQLRSIPMVIGVASGIEKANAVEVILGTGVLDAVVVDGPLAQALLD
jgi:DNA-binding transcriptional regulator LsrR (DeoR family)